MTINQDSRRFPLTKWDPGVLKIYLLRNNHELLAAKKRRKLGVCQDAQARGLNRDVTSFCCLRKVRKPVQCSCLM